MNPGIPATVQGIAILSVFIRSHQMRQVGVEERLHADTNIATFARSNRLPLQKTSAPWSCDLPKVQAFMVARSGQNSIAGLGEKSRKKNLELWFYSKRSQETSTRNVIKIN